MKNTTQLLALGLILFLGACTATEGNFLDKIKGKTAYEDATTQDDTTKIGIFSSDGRTFTFPDDPDVLTFVKASDENNGEYKLSDGTLLTFTTSDGKTGSTSSKDGSPTKLWFK